MAIEAVLFDFSGTLFRWEDLPSWSEDLVGADGRAFDSGQRAELQRRLTSPAAQPDGFDEASRRAWENRDLDPSAHRTAYLEVLRQSGLASEEHALRVYARLIDPVAWTPYPDAGVVLNFLAAHDIPVGVVSNLAFDPRPAFARHGWVAHVDAVALSYEVGVMKPDPLIFQAALDKIGVDPGAALMVGDSAVTDGGATELGCRFALVDPLPTAERPDALIDALRAHGLPVPR